VVGLALLDPPYKNLSIDDWKNTRSGPLLMKDSR
jgi:hypothetical protein